VIPRVCAALAGLSGLATLLMLPMGGARLFVDIRFTASFVVSLPLIFNALRRVSDHTLACLQWIGHVLKIVAPSCLACETRAKARPGAIERIPREPNQRGLWQQGSCNAQVPAAINGLVDDPSRLGKALVNPMAP
jgi:hypothetical protein